MLEPMLLMNEQIVCTGRRHMFMFDIMWSNSNGRHTPEQNN